MNDGKYLALQRNQIFKGQSKYTKESYKYSFNNKIIIFKVAMAQ